MIKKRNLDNSLIQWIMTQTSLGPGIGKIQYVMPTTSTTAKYASMMKDNGIAGGDVNSTLLAAEGKLDSYRNDIVLAFPGKYTAVLEHAWDKAHTHILGLGGPNMGGHWRTTTENDMRNVLFHTATASLASVINITGENCQFHNIQVQNEGAAADSYAAVIVDKFGFYAKNVSFRGATGATAVDTADCCSLRMDGAGHFPLFENCIIGHNTYSAGARAAAYGGHLQFWEGYPQNGRFNHCLFTLRSETAECGLVRFKQQYSADRTWIYDNCIFENFYPGYAAQLDAVFVYAPGVSPQTSNHLLHNCACNGFNEWSVADIYGVGFKQIVGSMPVASVGGGIAVGVTTDETET